MTEKVQALSTQIAPPSQSLFALHPAATAAIPRDVPHKVEAVEEEPYTIKCICNFSDDDGNTIYCETCDTWQHIECYYPDNVADAYREDFAHSCVECKPRSLNRQQAFERQRSRLSLPVVQAESADKKPKRPPSKNHKRKPKPSDLPVNGHIVSNEPAKQTSPQESAPPKKSKTSHKASHSVSSQSAKRSPSHSNTRNDSHGHPPSPATTPPDLPNDLEIHNYSVGFLSLYDEPDVQIVQSNSFANLMISNTMSLWLRDPQRMRQETGQVYDDVFQNLPSNIDSLQQSLKLEDKRLPISSATVLRWQYLTTPAAIEKDRPLIELNGQIGLQRDYCENPENRWNELSSPLPFVFFHPILPLYIDTRKEGSKARYVRRSCKPNAVLDTFLSDGSEYHFWLVSDRAIAADEQITISWDFRFPKKDSDRMLRLLGLGDESGASRDEKELDDSEYQTLAAWVHLILSEYGGCACELGSECAFARFHRNYFNRAQSQSRPQTAKKKLRKQKTQAISPTSTGHATNSRAPSEGQVDDLDHDARSTSASRSKTPSRDMTPARQGSFDTLGILTEPTDRDKRKVAMVEDSFRRMEQQQPLRKKKRTSDGTGSTSTKSKSGRASISHTTAPPNGVQEHRYVDVGTSRSKSGSPSSIVSPNTGASSKKTSSRQGSPPAHPRQVSVAPHSNYCDAAVQTDPVDGEWYSGSLRQAIPKRRVVSLSKKLLDHRRLMRLQEEARRKQNVSMGEDALGMDIDTPTSETKVLTESSMVKQVALPTPGDTPMPDAPLVSEGTEVSLNHPVTNGVAPAEDRLKTKSPELRVQLPPVPNFGGPAATASTTPAPLSASVLVTLSPLSTNNMPSPFVLPSVNSLAISPSPVKKKLSLSDYTKSRMNKAAAGKPTLGTNSLRPLGATTDETKSATSVEGPSIVESPTTLKIAEKTTATKSSTSAATPPAE